MLETTPDTTDESISANLEAEDADTTVRNISAVVVLRVAQFPFVLLAAVLIPRIMGVDTYGEYALIVSLISIGLSVMGFGGWDGVMGHFIPEIQINHGFNQVRQLASRILAFTVAFALPMMAVVISIGYLVYGDRFPPAYYALIAAIIVTMDWQRVPFNLLFGLNQLGRHALLEALRKVLSLALTLLLFYFYGLLGAITAIFVVHLTIGMLSFLLTRSYFRLQDAGLSLSYLWPYLKFQSAIYVSWILFYLWQSTGNVLIDRISGDARQVAYYDLANQGFQTLVSLLLITVISFMPIFSKLLATGREATLLRWSELVATYASMFCVLVFGVFMLLGSQLITWLIGSEYSPAFTYASVLLLGLFPMVFATLGYVLSATYDRPERYVLALCAAFAVFAVASVLLIRQYAGLGGAIAMALSAVVLAAAISWSFRRELVPCITRGIRVVAVGAIALPFIYWKGEPGQNILLAALFVLTYTGLLFLLGVMKVEDVRRVMQTFQRHSAV